MLKIELAEQVPMSMTTLALCRPASTRRVPAQTSREAGNVAMNISIRANCNK